MSGVSSSSKLKLSLLLPCRSVYIRLFSLHTHLDIEPKNQKKVKKSLESSFFSRNGFHPPKYEILLSNVPFMWTCENLKSLLFHILSTWKICEGIFSFRYFPCWCISSFLALPNTDFATLFVQAMQAKVFEGSMVHFCHYPFFRGVVNDSVLSFLCVAHTVSL